MSDHFGKIFTVSTFGESHGSSIGVIVSGLPAGVDLNEGHIQKQLDRRRPGQSRLTTARNEPDQVKILSGLFEGKTTGTALAMVVDNKDAHSRSYEDFQNIYRPSHADFTYDAKYGLRNWQGGGRASARETIARVAAGAVAMHILRQYYSVEILSWVQGVHNILLPDKYGDYSSEQIEASIMRCPEPEISEKMAQLVDNVRKEGDSVGGYISARIRQVPAGIGEPIFDRLEADLAKAMLSIPACKAFEIGSGFDSAMLPGSRHNDPLVLGKENAFEGEPIIRTKTNHAGGILGGISNGEDILFRVAFKPTATIFQEQQSVTNTGQQALLTAKGRHDPCVLPRAVPIVDAMAGLVILDHILRQEAYHVFQPNISKARKQ